MKELDVPTDLKDWWIFLIPGCFMLVEILFLYSAVMHAFPEFTGPAFNISDVWNYGEARLALLLFLVIVTGLVVGSVLEGLSSGFFERFQKKSEIISSAFQKTKNRKEEYVKKLLSDPKLFPADLWGGSFDAAEKNIEAVGEFIEAQLLHDAKKDESQSLNETAVAITFTQSFFLAFLLFPMSIIWMIVFEFTEIAILSVVVYFILLVYLLRDQRSLAEIYWKKTFDIFVSHLWEKKSGRS